MSISREDAYDVHRKDGKLYVIKGKHKDFFSLTSLFIDDKASSPEQAVRNWVCSWYNDGPTTVTVMPVRENVWEAAYTIADMPGTQEFLEKRAREWKQAAERKRQSSSYPPDSFMYVHAFILTEMCDIGYTVSDEEVREALKKVGYPDFW